MKGGGELSQGFKDIRIFCSRNDFEMRTTIRDESLLEFPFFVDEKSEVRLRCNSGVSQ